MLVPLDVVYQVAGRRTVADKSKLTQGALRLCLPFNYYVPKDRPDIGVLCPWGVRNVLRHNSQLLITEAKWIMTEFECDDRGDIVTVHGNIDLRSPTLLSLRIKFFSQNINE